MHKKIHLPDQTLQLKKFDLTTIPMTAIVCMIAKRNSGKSWVCRDLLYHKRNIPGGVIISKTDKLSSFYGDFFPSLYIHYQYDPTILENVLFRQKTIMKKLEEKKTQGKQIDPHAILIMDDCMADKQMWKKDQSIQEIFMNGRHYKLMYILTMQDPLGIEPSLRNNIDYVFILATDFFTNQRRIWEHYAGMFHKFEVFRKVFLECTQDFGCMVINNNLKGTANIDEKIFWFKAEARGKFDVGCKQFRDFSVANFDPKYDQRPKLFDITNFQKNSKLSVAKIDP